MNLFLKKENAKDESIVKVLSDVKAALSDFKSRKGKDMETYLLMEVGRLDQRMLILERRFNDLEGSVLKHIKETEDGKHT